jgi:hypothetical protein
MRTRILLAALLVTTLLAPSTASAAKTCVQIFEECLNDTWNTSGISRVLADLECAARYAGCLRAVIL